MSVQCKFLDSGAKEYTCFIKNQEIPSEVREGTFRGVHQGYRTIDDVNELRIVDSRAAKIPDKLGEVFNNLTTLTIWNSGLNEISKKNLRQFPNLEYLSLRNNQLEYLPGDLFEFNKKLEWIWLHDNKIKFIGPELLDGLPILAEIDLRNNQNINRVYKKNIASWTLDRLKEVIRLECQPPAEFLLKQKETEQIFKREKNAAKDQGQNSCCQINFLKDLKKFLAREDLKDFTIKVGSKEFKVHKSVFIIRSFTFTEMIKNNPDADELVLTDIPVEVFESILDFVYTDQPPKDTENAREIFAAAGKLKIESLMELSAEILMKEMEEEENLDFLMETFNFGVKFECEKLKLKAFEGIKKQFSSGELKNELLEDPEKLKALIEAKKMINEFMVKKNVGNKH